MIWFLYAVSLFTGMFFMVGSMWLAYSTMKASSVKKGPAEPSAEFAVELKWFKIKSSYPMLGMAMLGAALILYPIYDYSSKGLQPVNVEGRVVIQPEQAINDVVVKIMLGPWDMRADSDGKLSTTVHPDVKRYRVEVQAPGRPTLVKTVSVSETGSAEVGELRIAPPLVDFIPEPVAPVATGLPSVQAPTSPEDQ